MDTLPTLFKQRLRWMYGFINNTYDYRKYLLKSGKNTLPFFSIFTGILYIVATLVGTAGILWTLGSGLYRLITKLVVTNFQMGGGEMSWFYLDTRPTLFIFVILVTIFLFMALMSKKVRKQKPIPTLSFISFFILFSFIASAWLVKALYNTLMAREVAWR